MFPLFKKKTEKRSEYHTKGGHDTNWCIYFKHHGCSMLIFEGLTQTNAILRTKSLKRSYQGWKGDFIVTKRRTKQPSGTA